VTPFSSITSVAAVLEEDDVDTDIIFPARFLLLLDKAGLGKHVFHERRNARAGTNRPFVLDGPPFDKAKIFVAGRNFGTGSSREQAVWALADFGIRCVIASSFGEIFYANCFKNGVLPILRTTEQLAELQAAGKAGEELTVDLVEQTITSSSGIAQSFEVDAFRKEALLQGLDEIGSILSRDLNDIVAFEARQRVSNPWFYLDGRKLSFFDDLDQEKALE
jgi:3-isopropylmalate/(R)-2-methylmalate dehydratase small subunit